MVRRNGGRPNGEEAVMAATTMRRHAMLLSAAAVLALAIAGCGKSSGGNSALGDAPPGSPGSTTSSNPSPNPATQNSGGGGGGGGGGGTATQSPLYPKDAKSYGLEILKAIANKDNGRLVSLSSLNTANYAQTQNYSSKNGQWTNTDCTSGSSPMCSYYNQTGDIAQVGMDAAKLGAQGAGTSVYIEGGTYAKDATSYVYAFGGAWISGAYAHMVSLSSNAIADHFKSTQTFTAAGAAGYTTGTAHPCATNSSKTCVDLMPVGGTTNPPYQHLIVDMSRISAGKPNGIIGYEPAG
jgi:hypothetical protein